MFYYGQDTCVDLAATLASCRQDTHHRFSPCRARLPGGRGGLLGGHGGLVGGRLAHPAAQKVGMMAVRGSTQHNFTLDVL